jgi:hypothetical protein
MSALIDAGNTHWFKFMSRWALLAGLLQLGLLLAFFSVVLPAAQNSPLPVEYAEIAAASRNPALYRLTITLDVADWLALGGFLITLAVLLVRQAPIRGTFIAACGMGMVSGFVGAYTRLNATSELAARYLTAAPDQQATLLQSYLDIQRAISADFSAAGLLWGLALVLAASAAWSMAEFPRWLTVLIALPGLIQLPKTVFEIATGANLFLILIILEEPLLIVAYFAVARAFWRQTALGQAQTAAKPARTADMPPLPGPNG